MKKNIFSAIGCRLFLFVASVAFLFCGETVAQDNIRVRGHVVSDEGKPVEDVAVSVVETGLTVGVTDSDGAYVVVCPRDAKLVFSCIGFNDETVDVKGRLKIDVTMISSVQELEEVVVKVKVKNKVLPEPTDIEMKGNYFHVKTRFTVPKELFESDTRLVVQPSIYDITLKERKYMLPLVFDGREYNITQKRMYDYDIERDPLHDFITVKETGKRKSDLITYHDSLYVDFVDHDYRADVYMALEGYNKVIYRDTFSIAQGVVNPLRFFEYSLPARNLTDSAYIPKAEMQLMDSKGSVNLNFLIGKAVLDDKNPTNRTELERLGNELRHIENDKDASLHTMNITGIASPDGLYASNKRLSEKRTEAAFERIMSMLSASTRNVITSSSDSKVAEWADVVALMEADSLYMEAGQIDSIIDRFDGNRDRQLREIRKLPYYKSVVAEIYLPKLRKVEYEYTYSIFRFLTDEEVRALYDKNYKELTKNEFWRMFNIEKDTVKLEKIYRQALEKYPEFLIAANDLSALCNKQGKGDSKILEKFIDSDVPDVVIGNQIVALLQERKYEEAEMLLGRLSHSEDNAMIRAVTNVLGGNYSDGYDEIAKTGVFNEVLLLLCMKDNEKAWELSKQLTGGTAKEFYVKAVAANRTDRVGEAMIYMEQAFVLDPDLEEIAKNDGDLLDLLPEGKIE
jgi:hypothetical protein